MFAVQGIYANGTVVLDEPVPTNKKYDVIVTFVKPLDHSEKDTEREKKIAALARITGIITNNDTTLEEARAERLSRQ